MREFAGAHTRVVWVQDFSANGTDILAQGQRLKLMGFDSDDGRGERVILGELKNYAKPLLTPDGQRVVFSDQQVQKFYVVNWDGSGKKLLGDGLAVDVWRDPKNGVDWVYAGTRVGKPDLVTYRSLRRIKLNEPKTSEKVWDKTDVGCDNFQLSRDGTRAGGEFPWPNGGIANLQQKTWQKLEQGCWASIAPDNSGVSWVFDGPHRHLLFHRPDQTTSWKVNVNGAPGFNGAEAFHPRWSNHARYFALTGPFNIKGPVNFISGGGPQVEIYLGRFAPDYQSVEAWHPVTHNNRADFYPDVWIDGGAESLVELPGLANAPPMEVVVKWPPVTEGLLFAWNNGAQTNQLPERPNQPGRTCQLATQGRVLPGPYRELRFQGGTATPVDLGEAFLTAIKSSGIFTINLLVTPASSPTTSAALITIGQPQQPHLQLVQKGDLLEWRVRQATGAVSKPVMKVGTSTVVGLIATPRTVTIHVDGQPVEFGLVEPTIGDWKSGLITLGSPEWRGSVEALTISPRGWSMEEMTRHSQVTRQRFQDRKALVSIRIEATCTARSTIPPPADILPYRRALAVHEFRIDKLKTPASTTLLKAGDRILIAQWVILDGQVLNSSTQPALKQKVELTVESVSDHPELTSERQLLDTEDIDLPLYYDVTDAKQ